MNLTASKSHKEVLRRLLQALKPGQVHAALCSRNSAGCTPLWNAASNGKTATVNLLLAAMPHPAVISIPCKRGKTPLHAAALGGNAHVVARILQASPSAAASINLRCNDGLTALMYSARMGHLAAANELLEVPKCQLDIQDVEGNMH